MKLCFVTGLNRSGTTWRKLDDAVRAGVVDAASARELMLAQPSVIRRPLVEWPDGRLTVGFDEPGGPLRCTAESSIRPRCGR